MAEKVVQVRYEAGGGFLHRWVQGAGRFKMRVPADASEDAISRAAEQEAQIRAVRHVDHWNARSWDVEWEAAR